MLNRRVLLVLLITAVMLWFLFGIDDEAQKAKPVNVVSMQSQESGSQKTSRVMADKNIHDSELMKQNKSSEVDAQSKNNISYLDIYRSYQWAQVCKPYFYKKKEHIKNNLNLVFDYLPKYVAGLNAGKRYLGQAEVTPAAQLQVLEAYIQECEQVMEVVESLDDVKVQDAETFLLGLLLDMSAKSEKEKGIKAILAFQDKINITQAKLTERVYANNGEDNLEKENSEDVKQLRTMLLNLYAQVNAELLNQDFDVFYLAKTTAEMQTGYAGLGVLWYDFFRRDVGLDYTTPGEEIMQILNLKERHVFNQAAGPAGILYLCALGNDCSSDSLLMTSYCLGFNGLKSIDSSCRKDLLSFYSEDFIVPNLMKDIGLILELMEVEYGP